MKVTLKNENCEASICPRGAELKSLKVNGRELMWSADPAFWGKTSPLLFPMIGTLKNGVTLIKGKEYRVPRHGFARDFLLNKEAESDTSAAFSLSPNDTTKSVFPFNFRFTIQYTLKADGITVTQRVKNNDAENMPYCIGAHPAFAVQGEFTDHRLEFSKPETANVPYFNTETGVYEPQKRRMILDGENTLNLNHEMFHSDVLYLEHPASRSVMLLGKDNKGLRVDFPDFTGLGIWQAKDAPFLCIEPWCGSQDYEDGTGVFSEKQGIEILAPGEEKAYTYTITAIG